MKKLMFLLTVFYSLATSAQSYQVNFAGTGASSTVSTVKVENLTKDITQILNGSDILRLNVTTDIASVEKTPSSLLKIYPNPVSDIATLEVFPPVSGEMFITVLDISGKTVANYQGYSENFGESFRLSGLNNGIYIINVKGPDYQFSGKLISNGKSNGASCLEKVKDFPPENDIKAADKTSKVTMATIDMAYSIGDRLKFTGISGNYSTIKTSIISADTRITFNFIACTDDEGNNYPVVQIGTQTWMGENLRTTKFTDHSDIPIVTDNVAWSQLTTPGCCWYNNDIANKPVYGGLYNFYAVNSNKLCPVGWHAPLDSEWTTLTDFLGGQSIAGDKLKEKGYAHWSNYINNGTNETGFTALPGGARYVNGNGGLIFSIINSRAIFWSATMTYTLTILGENSETFRGAFSTSQSGHSVRCIKN